MKIISSKTKLKKFIHNEKNLGFVPTMGAIHLGHISLIKKCMSESSKTIVSIFINKTQFSKKNDFLNYPRVIKKDITILKKLKINYLYLPNNRQIYPEGHDRNIKISLFAKKLCGKFRPGHFEGVADVVNSLVKIIKPKRIYFGEKDMQQLKIIEHFFKKDKIRSKVIGCKTIREKNGLVYSSRNLLLTFKEKIIASRIYKLLKNNKYNLINRKINLRSIKKKILELGASKIDYINVMDVNKIIKPYKKNKKYKIFIAYYLRNIRLIDNI